MAESQVGSPVTVVVGVDGAGRTYRLAQLAAARGGTAVRIDPPLSAEAMSRLLATATSTGQLVVVDDAHRLGPDELRLLTAAARQGVVMMVARRPTIGSRELAVLDAIVTVRGQVHQLAALDRDGVAALIAGLGGAGGAEQVDALYEASAGLPAIAVALVSAPPGEVPPALVARVHRKLALLDPPAAGLARLLALRLDLSDAVLAAAAGLDTERLSAVMRTLRDEGLLVPGGEAMIPAVAAAIQSDLAPAERRRLHEHVAMALLADGGDVLAAATALRSARAFVPAAAAIYRAVGDRLRFDDPAAAIGWYDDATEAGSPAGVGRAEAAALLGLAVDSDQTVAAEESARLTLVAGAVEAHQGRAARCAQVLVGAQPPGPLLAVPALVGTGALEQATAAAASAGPVPVRRLAEAVLRSVTDPAGAVALFIEAAETVERTPPALVLPDTPHALGALVAAAAGETGSAELLLNRALAAGVGGPVAVDRHRLLLAWVRMRCGRYDTAVAELSRLGQATLSGREALLLAALSAGIARRGGDVATLREAWTAVEAALARRGVDLFTVEAVEELAVAATRLRRGARMAPVLDLLDGIVTGLHRPPQWTVSLDWIRVQVAIAEENAAAAQVAARSLAASAAAGGLPRRQRAQVNAANVWARVLAGEVGEQTVVAAAADLADAELPWEASRLVGQAAIRITDAAAARRLLERARELSSAEVVPAAGRAETAYAGLSEREVEVARMVLAGGTYREIGARLFISPKTVEHHVARIRTKLGATTRAEFVAALRTVLDAA